MDIRLNTTIQPNFQAKQIAKAYVKGTLHRQQIDLYSLDEKDLDFAKSLIKNLNLEKLYPHEKSYTGFKEWKSIIESGFSGIGTKKVILAAQNKKPCGVMTFFEKDKQLNLSYIAKWRPRPNQDVSFVGKVLMHHLFDVADKESVLNISLVPSHCFPRGKNCREFYSQFGFRRSAQNTFNLFGADYKQKAKKLEDYFEFSNIENAPIIDSNKEFDISFSESIFDKFRQLMF